MKKVMLNVIRRAKQTRFFAWFGGLSFALRITICAVTVVVIAGMVWGTASYIQLLIDSSEKSSIGADGDKGSLPGAKGDEYDAQSAGNETESLTETEPPEHNDAPDSGEPSDTDNETSDEKNENHTDEGTDEEQQGNDLIIFQENVHTPTWVMDDVIMVSADNCYTMAIRSDGSLWGWGNNWHGQLCIDPQTDYNPDSYHEDLVWIMDDDASVSVGISCVMAIRTDGSLWAWGWNVDGMLGIT